MHLTLQGHDRYFAVEQSLLNYFPPNAPGTAISKLSQGALWQTASAVIGFEGKRAKGFSRAKPGDNPDHALKTAFYRAARQLTEPPPWGALTGIRPAKKALEILKTGLDPIRELKLRYDVAEPQARLAAGCADFAWELEKKLSPYDISLYIGIPFCPSKCAYCSFISTAAPKQKHLIGKYCSTLSREIRQAGELCKKLGLRVRTVYWGGGTPTVLSPEELRLVFAALGESFDLNGTWEYTVEAGRPDTITEEKSGILKSHETTRISINPQSLSPEVLAAVGREHTPEMFFEAFSIARKTGFESINADIIAGLPGDTAESFRHTLEGLVGLYPENITVHTLAKKKGSRVMEDNIPGGNADVVEESLDFAEKALLGNGYLPYYLYRQKFTSGGRENVGWSLAGKQGLYNLCMMEELSTILALGAGGVTKLVDPATNRIERFFQCKYPLEYLERCDKINENLNMFEKFCRNKL
ncbi:MAG: coproporphyrinogen dehydrogenase HemZ [Oscillospiraceae bacterium]|nr:coproporphyrinogen dehydrogenase HemZ [Oscillospiraceae bacterium]